MMEECQVHKLAEVLRGQQAKEITKLDMDYIKSIDPNWEVILLDTEDAQVKELLDLLKQERRVITLHYVPTSEGNGFGGIQYQGISDEIRDRFNSYPTEVQIKAIQAFTAYIIEQGYKNK